MGSLFLVWLIFLRRRGLIAGCENYYKGCKTAYKLPTAGVLLDQKCPKCNLPLIKLKTKTRCLNTKCEGMSLEGINQH